jgi:hypothetical protein
VNRRDAPVAAHLTALRDELAGEHRGQDRRAAPGDSHLALADLSDEPDAPAAGVSGLLPVLDPAPAVRPVAELLYGAENAATRTMSVAIEGWIIMAGPLLDLVAVTADLP